jgi:hypothetical protein
MAMFPAMHRVGVPVAPHTPLFELAVPCAVFGLDRLRTLGQVCSLPHPWDAIHLCARRPRHSMLSED